VPRVSKFLMLVPVCNEVCRGPSQNCSVTSAFKYFLFNFKIMDIVLVTDVRTTGFFSTSAHTVYSDALATTAWYLLGNVCITSKISPE
jgi:hypothetical protein